MQLSNDYILNNMEFDVWWNNDYWIMTWIIWHGSFKWLWNDYNMKNMLEIDNKMINVL
jgi:hypothetical protein